jgi:uncharacterized protein (DUF1778 family)
MKLMTKNRDRGSRLEARVNPQQKYLFKKAADLSGLTLTDFLIIALQSMASQVIREHETLKLVGKDRQIFIRALLKPPAPNDLLIKTVQRYKEEVISK